MRDSVLEDFFKKWGATYEYHASIHLDSVHLTDAARQNIRPVGIDDEKALEYGIALEDGASFPAIVIYPLVKGGYGLLSGCHRVVALTALERQTIDAYVVALDETKDERIIEVYQRVLNTLNGLGYDVEERIQHAVRLHRFLGYKKADAARMMHLKTARLDIHLGAIDARERGAALHVERAQINLKDTALSDVNRIKNDHLFKAALELAHSARLTTDQVKELCREIREATTEGSALEVLAKWKTNLASVINEGANGQFASPSSPFRKRLQFFRKLERECSPSKQQEVYTKAERHQLVRVVKAAIANLQKLLRQLEQPHVAAGVLLAKERTRYDRRSRHAH